MTVLVSGGAGFIGSNFVLGWFARNNEPLINLDKLTYAGNPANLGKVEGNPDYVFVHGDIGDRALVRRLLERHSPRAIVHFAAESHVDRSIHGPGEFVQTNVIGTFSLLEEGRAWWQKLAQGFREAFRFLHVSTDEVYGSLSPDDAPFRETSAYAPNSPYAASKAASDHLVRAYHRTYGLPTLITNCSNNYGPYQFPEKLIPLMILNALAGKPLPVYGDGGHRRDWLHVQDHCTAILDVLARGRTGETYNIGGNEEKTNLEVVRAVCALLDEARPGRKSPHAALISFVKDRPGHDRRYAMDATKISRELGWKPAESFESGLRKTVAWYLDNPDWVAQTTSGAYRSWIEKNYAKRGKA
ncbi:MAG TPA: dTDP-glucose 4,6-dehydratase [Burkholderiales bacterium]|nr:dTDP-glucose 4,6-dehydratase [Burkholderiales bacterium]